MVHESSAVGPLSLFYPSPQLTNYCQDLLGGPDPQLVETGTDLLTAREWHRFTPAEYLPHSF